MTLYEPSSVSGVSAADVRVGKLARMLKVYEQIAKDQSAIYTQVTGLDIPNGAGAAADSHVHDGTDGAIIPIPIAHGFPNANIGRRTADTSINEWARLVETPFRPPPGCTRVRWVGFSSSPSSINNLRPEILDSSRAGTAGKQLPIDATNIYGRPGSYWAFYLDMDVTADTTQILRVDAWDAAYERGSNNETMLAGARNLISWMLLPVVGIGPRPEANPWAPGLYLTDADTILPTSTTHLSADYFSSQDDDMYSDYEPLSGYIPHSAAYNDALLWELLTDTPAGNNGSKTVKGHNHAGDTSINSTGAKMEQPLGCWSYGVARNKDSSLGFTSVIATVDEPSGNAGHLPWAGHIHAPTLTSTGSQEMARHHVRIPATLTADAQGATTRLTCELWIYLDAGKSGNVSFDIHMEDESGTTIGTAQSSATISSTGHHLVTINNVETATAISDGRAQVLVIKGTQGAAVTQGMSLYGSLLRLTS